jgi:hypothetical protein
MAIPPERKGGVKREGRSFYTFDCGRKWRPRMDKRAVEPYKGGVPGVCELVTLGSAEESHESFPLRCGVDVPDDGYASLGTRAGSAADGA